MTRELTRRQGAILDFIIESIHDKGYPPTIAEIGVRFRIASTNGVNDHLVALERKGFIQRAPKARGIHVTEKATTNLYHNAVATLPLVGRVAAGAPILAEENVEDRVPVSGPLARVNGYCLRIRGDSMIEDGIYDGDIIIVDKERRAATGDIIVALIGDDATVKRYYPHGERVELRPANESMQSIILPASSVEIQGVVVGLHRIIKG
jgi:repressor LexA